MEKLFFSIALVSSILSIFDFVLYAVRSAPKKAFLSRLFWKFGFICTIAVLYYFMNGMKFI